MKPSKQRTESHHPGQETADLAKAREMPASTLSGGRLWLFRLCAMILGPLVMFGGAELALRLCGYGYPTTFFLPARIQGQDFYVPNPKFTYRFFSAAQARSGVPLRMPVKKSANAYRIFLFGESAANGDPDPSYGVGRYLEILLRERFPRTEFEVECVAITGINTHTILPIARECGRHQGDLWIIYMGNNEMVGPFGAQTVFGTRAPNRLLVQATLAARATRVGQLLDATAGWLRAGSHPAGSWGGMQMFLHNRLRHDDPARLRAYDNFRENLEAILRVAQTAGVPVLMSTVAVNLRDCAPFASLHASGLTEQEMAAWDKSYETGVALEAAGSYREALAQYQAAAEIDSQYADLRFRMGSCELALSNPAQARREFELANDYDALAFRADSVINQTIKAAAARHAIGAVGLLDAADIFAQKSPAGIPGLDLFYEHVHLNFEGNYLLALSFAEQIKKLLPESASADDQGKWAAAEVCDRRLAVTVWDRQRVWQPIFNRITFPPFTGQLNHETFFRRCEDKLNAAKARMSWQTPEQARQMYHEALTLAPNDSLLHANFEKFLESGGELTQALAESQRVCELAPFMAGPFFCTGSLLVRLGRIAEARENLARAVALKEDFAPAHNELGWILAGEKNWNEARAAFGRAQKADPGGAETFINLGLIHEYQGDVEKAMASYEQAALLQPQGPAEYFNRAVKLGAAHHPVEAIECFRNLLLREPAFWQARFRLGAELVKVGRQDEAQGEFVELLRYRPNLSGLLPGSAKNVQTHARQQ